LQLFVHHSDRTAGCATGQTQTGAGDKGMNVSRSRLSVMLPLPKENMSLHFLAAALIGASFGDIYAFPVRNITFMALTFIDSFRHCAETGVRKR